MLESPPIANVPNVMRRQSRNETTKYPPFEYYTIIKMKHLIFFALLFIEISYISCSKEHNCLSYEKAYVTKVDGNSNGHINEELILQVYFGCHNSCGQFGNFEESTSGNTRLIVVNAKYEGCACTDIAPEKSTTYKFKTSQAGTYYLKFYRTDSTYLIDTLSIQ